MSNPIMSMASPKAKQKQDQARLSADRKENMIMRQMETSVGRDFVWHVLKQLGYMQNITDTNASVYGRTAKQAVANDLAREIKKICPELFMRMENEKEA